ncbi:MAG TPA: biopolymer transporter TolR [Opitutaceae bacterium]
METTLRNMTAVLALSPLGSLAVATGVAAVGKFAEHGDIGAPAIAGSVSYDESLQEYRLGGAGANVWATSDQFHFAWNKMKGDFILRARFEFVGQGVDAHRKLGWMVRATLDADSAYADACAHGDGLTSLQFRRGKGAVTEQIELPLKGGDVIQLERRGRDYIFSCARYGEPFVSATLRDVDLGDEVYAGLFLCSHDATVKEHAIVRDVRIIKPARPGFQAYRDFIGSQLEILHVFNGRLTALYQSAEPFEAPNWMHDGKTLIWNVSGAGPNKGLLRTFDRTTGAVSPLDTGIATHNNNDHVLSFDGTMLAISNNDPAFGGKSAIYTVPATGGPAKLITAQSPSYLHGWSPDGQWLVFTGIRDGDTEIYKIPSAGGGEIRLTDGPGMSDGPEYSPDGRHIYFNSTRSGRMQLWRMKPDGSEPEQLTNDEFNNWFPHLSPDGKWIVFISYGQDVAPESHPYYQHVYLRLMPAGGGPARVIAYVYGGQGTMNVPSWSPDGTRIAFVSNSDFAAK